ncbi:MAG: class 1 fructose-bisphosphatase [Gemmatimonadales bacterium]|nr:class 1 fructose-bisphosphatase [Gemmatimonadales bacterium]
MKSKLEHVVTIERHIMDQERMHPEATGALSNLLYDVGLAAKIINGHVRMAGLADILGSTKVVNVQGEVVQKLDEFAEATMQHALLHTGRVCVLASEEDEQPILIPDGYPSGKYTILYDPLDGSSNIDVNVSIGTIFSIHSRVTPGDGPGSLVDCLQPGRTQVAAGYVLYGSSTMMVYTTGHGVHGFTFDPTIGEFLLSHPDITTPAVGKYYSVNESYFPRWDPKVQALIKRYKGLDDNGGEAKNCRYIGSLVADFHRNLIAGGVFCYPADKKAPTGKLRLLYECAPLAFICEQAGGYASDGTQAILDIVPTELHQRSPLYIGSRDDVRMAERMLSGS